MSIKRITAGAVLAAFISAGGGLAAAGQPAVPPAARPPLSRDTVKYANNLHLAYVRTPSDRMNSVSEKGLGNLSSVLREKTAIEPAGVAALDIAAIERGDMLLFPFIYWPVTENATPLSQKALKAVRDYMKTGGVVLFDIDNMRPGQNYNEVLRRKIGDLGIGPLVPVGQNDSLTSRFYRTNGLPGSSNLNPVVIETPGAGGTDSISPVIAGANNWAMAWAGITAAKDSGEWEQAIRAGVNIVIYALAGNRKADQPDAVIKALKK